MKYERTPFKLMILGACTSALLFGCSTGTADKNSSGEPGQKAETAAALIGKHVSYGKSDAYATWDDADATMIKFDGTKVAVTGKNAANATYKNRILTINAAGTYVISGKLNDGQVLINAGDADKVRLILDNAILHAKDRSPIYVKNADKAIISLPKGTKNTISDGKTYTKAVANEQTAAIFSKDDLTINGSGELEVNASFNDGIVSKDDLHIMGGDLRIEAKDDGIIGRDSFAVKDGKVTIKAGGDAIKSTNADDSTKGFVALENGEFELESGKEGIQAETGLWISDGTYEIKSGGGSPEHVVNEEERPGEREAARVKTKADKAGKGLKVDKQLVIDGGTFTIDAADDGLHSNGEIAITGGKLAISSGDDGIHADEMAAIKGGDITVKKSKEGLESATIHISGGNLAIKAADDGINATNGKQSAPAADEKEKAASSPKLLIEGGTVHVNADGDGLDSNGTIDMTGGTVTVSGPTNGGNGALDYDETFTISGGVLAAAGSAGMAQAVSDSSQQYALHMTFPTVQKAGTLIHLEDDQGAELLNFAPEKEFETIVISTPELRKGKRYGLSSGGEHSGKAVKGLYGTGTYSGGKKIVSFKIAETVTYLNEKGTTDAPAGHMGGPGGNGNEGMPPQPEAGGPEGPEGMFDSLDEAARDEAMSIMEKERSGEMTRKAAQAALKKLGISMPDRPEKPTKQEGK